MKIELKDETQKLILSDEELDNCNFIDLFLYDEMAKDKDNPRGFVSEYTASLEDLKCAVDAFWTKKLNSKEDKL